MSPCYYTAASDPGTSYYHFTCTLGTTSASSTDDFCSNWTVTATTASTPYFRYSPGRAYICTEETAEQRQAREARERIRDEQERQKQQQRAMAEEVAQRLIADVFGDETLKEYKTKRTLTIDSPSKAGRRYVLQHGTVDIYEGRKLVDRLCVHLHDGQGHNDSSWLPTADIVCGKALHILNDEERFLAVAHHDPR